MIVLPVYTFPPLSATVVRDWLDAAASAAWR
jgi:hypothetical protein